LKIGKIFGIEIILQFSFFIILGLMTGGLWIAFFPSASPESSKLAMGFFSVLTAVIFFLSVFLHELSHCAVSKYYCGIAPKSITFWIFGGIAELGGDYLEKGPKKEFFMAAAGPAASFLLAGLFYIGQKTAGIPIAQQAAYYLATINLYLGLFNLMPAFPMDGGRIFRSALWLVSGNLLKATKASYYLALVMFYAVLPAIIYFLFGWWNALFVLLVGCWFLKPAAMQETKHIFLTERLKNLSARNVMIATVARGRHIYDVSIDLREKPMTCAPHDNALKVYRDFLEKMNGSKKSPFHIIYIIDGNGIVIGAISFEAIFESTKI
jgi:Zn-dependent protease